MTLSRLRYGNCLLGFIAIVWHFRARGHTRIHWSDDYPPIPHALFQDQRGRWHHYKVIHDLLPMPWCIFWFRGRFAKWRPYVKDRSNP